jgi:hypothetical protein
MFYSPYFIIGIPSIIFIYFEKIESKTAGKVCYISTNRTGIPFLTAPFTSGTKLEAFGLVKTLREDE